MTNNSEKLLLFDVDGTIAQSGQQISLTMETLLIDISRKYKIGIVGGGKLDKILWQIGEKVVFDHYFTECGCVYHTPSNNNNKNKNNKNNYSSKLEHKYTKNLREHPLYPKINVLVKTALGFLSQAEYMLSGNFIDLRNGIIYISLIGMSATQSERETFIELDMEHQYRTSLIEILLCKARSLEIETKIQICEGGHVGIAVYPIEYDKEQVVDVLLNNSNCEIHYFGDKYQPNGNDYRLINNPNIIGHKIDSIDQTIDILEKMLI